MAKHFDSLSHVLRQRIQKNFSVVPGRAEGMTLTSHFLTKHRHSCQLHKANYRVVKPFEKLIDINCRRSLQK